MITFVNTLFNPDDDAIRVVIHNSGMISDTQFEYFVSAQVECQDKAQRLSAAFERINVNHNIQTSKGLSKNRNNAINHCETDYIWFLDDDVILADTINKLDPSILVDLNAFKAAYYEDGKFIRKYSTVKSKTQLHRSRSVEICWSLRFLKNKNLLFNEQFGSGALYSNSEEMLLINKCLRYGASFKFFDFVAGYHLGVLTDRIQNKNEVYAKGRAFSQIGWYAIPLVSRYAVGLFYRGKSTYIGALLKGYFDG